MSFLTYRDIKQYASSQVQRFSLSESAILKEASGSHIGKKIFLSHSSYDKEHIAGIVSFFENFNASVYVDVDDKRLPKPPSQETASILCDVIRSCPRFVIVVSPNSHTSKWIPWELGLAHGHKGLPPIAILPISSDSNEAEWAKQEYIGLYPRIVNSNSEWKVYDPRDQKHWGLSQWLTDPLR